ncbi:hypothetical protein Pan97_26280 [Bremerella volcania]|uniref:Neutral/alkaline non-lysosomal ceramidase n=1 Tax=Bremerella volcania TaxID=2527984 RepID=A0A518C8R9_9BACT|nr:hypothetical protein [Bremerella volcania]QDU75594.1 hypothetical protein Pan97_26280 [Bremerella volcania]
MTLARYPSVLLILLMTLGFASAGVTVLRAESLKVATFEVDASPPIGSPLAYDPTKGIQSPLSFRGIILQGQDSYVLCSVDWLGVSSDSQKNFKRAIAEAVGTDPKYVVIHAIHQHDAPRCDATTQAVFDEFDLDYDMFDLKFIDQMQAKAAAAAKQSLEHLETVTHIGTGQAEIEKVASNRRILGPDGKVKYVRYTATKDPVIRAQPIGTIDPMCKSISFWNGDRPLAVMTYYATHPQSYYRTGLANPDFPGMARNAREEKTKTFHIHFNGAGGNIGAGKWNDGAKENREVLAKRVEDGMQRAWEATTRRPIEADDVTMTSVDVLLPLSPYIQKEEALSELKNKELDRLTHFRAARELAWLRRNEAGDAIAIQCLAIGDARILHMPGELFVEYQLAAQKLRPDLFVAMAAYGDYAPGYIGTEVSYGEGGYETSRTASRVSGRAEQVLMGAITKLLQDDSAK